MLDAITTGFTTILGWAGTFVNDMLSAPAEGEATLYVLLPVVGLFIGYGAVKFGIYVVKSFLPGI